MAGNDSHHIQFSIIKIELELKIIFALKTPIFYFLNGLHIKKKVAETNGNISLVQDKL